MGSVAHLDWRGRRNEYAGFGRRNHSSRRIPCSSSSSSSSSSISSTSSSSGSTISSSCSISSSGSSSITRRREGLSRFQRRWPRCHHLITFVVFAATIALRGRASASSNPMELNGGSCLAMAGKGCVALAVDRRFGLEGQLVSTDAKRVLKINGQLLCGFTGLWTDALTVMQNVASEVALKGIEDDRPISPAAFAGLLSTLLYSRRRSPFFVEPIIAGLDSSGKPYLCGQDMLGAPVTVDDFVVAGTSAQSLYGTCEAFFRVGMEREELFLAASRCLLSALERDCLSGYGAVVHLITEEGIETRELATRMD